MSEVFKCESRNAHLDKNMLCISCINGDVGLTGNFYLENVMYWLRDGPSETLYILIGNSKIIIERANECGNRGQEIIERIKEIKNKR